MGHHGCWAAGAAVFEVVMSRARAGSRRRGSHEKTQTAILCCLFTGMECGCQAL